MNNLLMDAKELRHLQRKVDKCRSDLETLKKSVLAPLEAKKNKHSLLEASINEYEKRLLELRGDIDMKELQDEGRLAHALEELEAFNNLETELKKRRDEAERLRKPMKKMLESYVNQRDSHITQLVKEKTNLTGRVQQIQDLHAELCARMSQVRVHWTEMKSSVSECEAQIQAWKSEIEKLETVELAEKDSLIETEATKISHLTDELTRLNGESANLRSRLDSVETEIQQMSASIEEEKQFIQDAERDIRDLKSQVDSVTKHCQQNEDEMRRQVISDQDAMEAVREEVAQLSTEELKNLVESSTRQRSKLQMKIDKRALELLAQVEKDFQELNRDKERVQQERDSVIDFIENLDMQKKKKLETSLVQVDSFLNQLFGSLLPGAAAGIAPLTDDLQDGLELRVVLGKTKKQSLSELSGGQKSLLALSLILAMLKLNPAPFYILDEVDAALDVSHTEHLGDMIKRFFSESQFIIVSHKDNLYKNADVLFRTSFVNGTSTITRSAA
eukprot:Blabericola_migrator_1__2209@NODE_160_length_12527_cov_93_130417_g140_i0_p4_GENE_NODE_160_length_12527_cov_93_130417_g140_i0NODE_160_length_12527_cov_93_130417_g140_i0_p4_ORF_typecomplete_len503_score144_43SMC_N/PF02463_19/1_9e38AAA_21/PF13304_6/1_5e03AAA_21/PF13304_6/2_5e12AAA_13/PF13166_6/0_012AAA_13/PF13166_6/4_8e08AAA_15/PF13175_6/1_9e06MAD/PF05557_13/1_4e08MAD/PF05557_13/0_0025UPF0242/PF06785_11/0_087UPF0242/PF06785_11/0_0015UPF0242/PF06785_11/0_017Filament/PF00038_21/2_3Filament/PF00038_21